VRTLGGGMVMIMVMAATVNCLPALKLLHCLTYGHRHSLLTSALYRTFIYLLTYKCINLDCDGQQKNLLIAVTSIQTYTSYRCQIMVRYESRNWRRGRWTRWSSGKNDL